MKKQQLKDLLHRIIFGADTPLGRKFDLVLIGFILASIFIVILESVPTLHDKYWTLFYFLEWFFTIVFTLEYILRICIVNKPIKFVFSFFGIIDLLSILPTYIALFVAGTQGLMVIRALRLLRVFRVLKLNRYINESNYIVEALRASRYKIGVFIYAVLMIIIVVGAVMYLIEGEQYGFDSIPRSMYWVVVTITTVGYGDLTPHTTIGQFIASFIMILGYAIIAVPTGIVSSEMNRTKKSKKAHSSTCCQECLHQDHEADAKFCRHCGAKLGHN